MNLHRFVALIGLATLIMAGCSEGKTPDLTSPSNNFANGPATPGPLILRLHEPDWFVFLFPDLQANLTASVGFEERFSTFCEPAPIAIPPEDLQFLFSPTGRLALLVQGRDMPVIIYAGAIPGRDIGAFCAQLSTAPIIATGMAHIV